MKTHNLEMAVPLGIASEGPVFSVYLGLQREHEEFFNVVRIKQVFLREKFLEADSLFRSDARRIARYVLSETKVSHDVIYPPGLMLTSASATSAALTKVLLNLWLGPDIAQQMILRTTAKSSDLTNADVGQRPVELVIGDEALLRRHEFWKILDLGQTWFELTSLPFVFGLWQTSHPSINMGAKALLWEAASLAQVKMVVQPQIYYPDRLPVAGDGRVVDLGAYWKVIQYKLTERHLQSLLLYYALYQKICHSQDDDRLSERLVRWSQTWQHTGSVVQ
jgi:predicted solute-binding protein